MQLFEEASPIFKSVILETGIDPLPEILSSLRDMPPPRNAKRGQTISRLYMSLQKICAEICRHFQTLLSLTMEDVPFEWTKTCHDALTLLKNTLQKAQFSNLLIWNTIYFVC